MIYFFMISIVVCVALIIYLALISDEKFINSLSSVKKRDRSLKNWEFFGVVFLVILVEFVVFTIQKYPVDIKITIMALSAYLPVAFLFYCNIFVVGNRRELIWVLIFIILCLSSLFVFDRLRLEIIIPISALFTILICYIATRDSYAFYCRGCVYWMNLSGLIRL